MIATQQEDSEEQGAAGDPQAGGEEAGGPRAAGQVLQVGQEEEAD